MLIEILSPLFPNYFILIASTGNIGKNISWLTSSATRASINKSFIKNDNLGDITGKSGSQTITASLIGTGAGVLISSVIGMSYSYIIATFVVCYSMQLYASVKSVLSVEIKTINYQRGEIIIWEYLKSRKVLTTREVSKRELIFNFKYLLKKIKIKINQNIEKIPVFL
jgi:hypothetical protein